MDEDTKPYAVCEHCPATFPDRASQEAHMRETIRADGALSHSTRVVYPTVDERAHQSIQYEIESAMEYASERLMEELLGMVERGDVTVEQVDTCLSRTHFADAWAANREEL